MRSSKGWPFAALRVPCDARVLAVPQKLAPLCSAQTSAASQTLMRAARAGQIAALLGCAHSPRTRLTLRLAGWGVGAAERRQGRHIV